MKRLWVSAVSFVVFAGSVGGADAYHKVKAQELNGPPSWDLLTVDENARRVYVSHSTQVEVLDADSLASVGSIPNVAGSHGIALATEFHRGFATAGKADAVTIFDTQNLGTIGQVKVGKKPDAIVYDPASKRVFVMNGDSNSTTAVNASDGKVAGTVDLGGGPEFAVVDGKGNLYVDLEEQSQLVHVDTQNLKVKDHWPVAPCRAPSSLAFDVANRRLFLGCRSRVMAVMDADSGQVVANFPIGDHVDASVFDSNSKRVFNSTGDGNISIFREDKPDSYSVVGVVATVKGSKTMALDGKTGRLFVPANDNGKFTMLIFGE